ncbi:MAG: hypothetical protein U0169_11080 [Polyangiaceae bacterium]
MIRNTASALAFVSCLVGCSRGEQTLYLVTDRPEDLTVSIDGKVRDQPLHGFQAYGSVNLTKGAEVVVESAGTTVERVTLPAVAKEEHALFVVGSPGAFAVADYRKLAVVTDGKGRGGSNGTLGIGPVTAAELDVVPVDPGTKTLTFDRRAIVAGPDAPLPSGGAVNPVTLEKLPIYRVEHVLPGTSAFDSIAPKVTRELGRDRLPGQR